MRRLLGLFVTLLLISCNQEDTNSYKLAGSAAGYENGTQLFLYEIAGNNQPKIIDTLEVQEGSFSGTYPKVDNTSLQLLRVDGTKNNILFFVENEALKATIYKDSLRSSRVTGGKQNEIYIAYNKGIANFNKKKQQISASFKQAQLEQDNMLANQLRADVNRLISEETAYKKSFVTENTNSLFSVMLLNELFTKEEITTADATKMINNLSPKMAAHEAVTQLKETMKAKKKADVGGKAPEFTAPTPTGELMSLNDALGKYTIIDFWASWCRPCRMENPNVVRVYEKYHDKGLNIISVSLDKASQKQRWIKAIEDDQMDWYHVSNLQFWSDPIARQYNVRSIPATFLLDEEGNIIDKNLRGRALEAKIASLLD